MDKEAYEIKLSRRLYYAAVIIIIAAAGVFAVCSYLGISLTLPECAFLSTTGFYCVGCGGTRAFNALCHGHVFLALRCNAFVPYFFAVTAVFLLSHTASIVSRNKIHGMRLRPVWFIAGLAVLLLQCAVKNIFVLCGINYF